VGSFICPDFVTIFDRVAKYSEVGLFKEHVFVGRTIRGLQVRQFKDLRLLRK
jgi:hypothetical protein